MKEAEDKEDPFIRATRTIYNFKERIGGKETQEMKWQVGGSVMRIRDEILTWPLREPFFNKEKRDDCLQSLNLDMERITKSIDVVIYSASDLDARIRNLKDQKKNIIGGIL